MHPLRKVHTDVREAFNQELDEFVLKTVEQHGPITSFQVYNRVQLVPSLCSANRDATDRALRRLRIRRLVVWSRADGWRAKETT